MTEKKPDLAQDCETVRVMCRGHMHALYEGTQCTRCAALARVIEAARRTLGDGAPLICMYCGREDPEGTPEQVLADHIRVCPKHPLAAALAEVERLTRERDTLKEQAAVREDLFHANLVAREKAEARVERLREALRKARGYVAAVHGQLVPAVGENTLVKPDLDLIDAALSEEEADRG